ncbi:hypothetical protein GGS21DRAFT_496710 [Xylaria nigripes]|nr:hypothetical protein GGS21DRAFT_496710 [Xylaria nigripes]
MQPPRPRISAVMDGFCARQISLHLPTCMHFSEIDPFYRPGAGTQDVISPIPPSGRKHVLLSAGRHVWSCMCMYVLCVYVWCMYTYVSMGGQRRRGMYVAKEGFLDSGSTAFSLPNVPWIAKISFFHPVIPIPIRSPSSPPLALPPRSSALSSQRINRV